MTSDGNWALRILKKRGIPVAPPDHWIYSEGASSTFVNAPLPSDSQKQPDGTPHLEKMKKELDAELKAKPIERKADGTYTAIITQGKPPSRRKFRIAINYGYDIHSVTVPAKIVDQIKRGEAVTVKGQGFYIEGEKTQDVWSFHCTGDNELEVEGDNGHQIYIGKVSSTTITEIK